MGLYLVGQYSNQIKLSIAILVFVLNWHLAFWSEYCTGMDILFNGCAWLTITYYITTIYVSVIRFDIRPNKR